ncbi:hypothetical protein [Roseofilum capinflatum]|uniref:Uncharacterized protein n=1 Tax=Roseofilum capinflatum BLCC-M114 TaxID=3022440 RepID=A0ABT7B5G8_9CYAN|nr:hypothetical protein [Roseofilum capinflatum]MDJ1174422.1 hypothetical protein [Roseofilum capinflatum BLCC-M114]
MISTILAIASFDFSGFSLPARYSIIGRSAVNNRGPSPPLKTRFLCHFCC